MNLNMNFEETDFFSYCIQVSQFLFALKSSIEKWLINVFECLMAVNNADE